MAAAAVLVAAAPARAADKSPPTTTPAPPPAPAAAPSPSPAPPADAEAVPSSPQEAEMQSQRALGHRLFRLGRYEEAVAAFRRAYEVKADARLLFDIAECYREVGAVDQALFYYDRYLAGWPDAFDRAEVEDKVADLESKRGSPAPHAGIAARRRHPVITMEPLSSKPRPPPRPWQRWWFWTAVGVGVLGAIAASVALTSPSGSSIPPTDLGDKRFF